MDQQLILVDEYDNECGFMDKMEVHEKGLLHRAFSIFIFNPKGEMLLQLRAPYKYHSGGLWSNACCSHPQQGETTMGAARRRLIEEMGIDTPLEKVFDFIYRYDFNNGLTEHEFDHVFAGVYGERICKNNEEVMDYCYKDIQEIRHSLETHPQKYSAWFHLAFPGIENWWNRRYQGCVAQPG